MIVILTAIILIFLSFMVTCAVFDSRFALETIDYFAFFAAIFLILEAMYKLITMPKAPLSDKILRTIRLIIGTCVFTIHLLQFMRY